MIKALDVIKKIEEFAPLALQEDYDNSGLQIGAEDTEVKGIMIALNLDLDVIKEAKEKGANFILTHHPILFNPISEINPSKVQWKVLYEAIKNDFVVYAAHTSCDNAEDSIGVQNLKLLGVKNIYRDGEVLFGDIDTNIALLRNDLEKVTGDTAILSTHLNKPIKKVAYINGSGGRESGILDLLIESKVDCYISSEFKYSFLLDLVNSNIEVLELNHFNSEKIFNEIMKNKLCTDFNNVFIYSKTQNPYSKE